MSSCVRSLHVGLICTAPLPITLAMGRGASVKPATSVTNRYQILACRYRARSSQLVPPILSTPMAHRPAMDSEPLPKGRRLCSPDSGATTSGTASSTSSAASTASAAPAAPVLPSTASAATAAPAASGTVPALDVGAASASEGSGGETDPELVDTVLSCLMDRWKAENYPDSPWTEAMCDEFVDDLVADCS